MLAFKSSLLDLIFHSEKNYKFRIKYQSRVLFSMFCNVSVLRCPHRIRQSCFRPGCL